MHRDLNRNINHYFDSLQNRIPHTHAICRRAYRATVSLGRFITKCRHIPKTEKNRNQFRKPTASSLFPTPTAPIPSRKEADFLQENKDKIFPIEIKRNSTPTAANLKTVDGIPLSATPPCKPVSFYVPPDKCSPSATGTTPSPYRPCNAPYTYTQSRQRISDKKSSPPEPIRGNQAASREKLRDGRKRITLLHPQPRGQ